MDNVSRETLMFYKSPHCSTHGKVKSTPAGTMVRCDHSNMAGIMKDGQIIRLNGFLYMTPEHIERVWDDMIVLENA